MITVADTSPLRYLILVEAIDVLPRIFGQLYAPPEVMQERGAFRSPELEAVRRWAASPPAWLTVQGPRESTVRFNSARATPGGHLAGSRAGGRLGPHRRAQGDQGGQGSRAPGRRHARRHRGGRGSGPPRLREDEGSPGQSHQLLCDRGCDPRVGAALSPAKARSGAAVESSGGIITTEALLREHHSTGLRTSPRQQPRESAGETFCNKPEAPANGHPMLARASEGRATGAFLIVAARCLVCGEPVCLGRSTYQNNYECPLRLPIDAKEGTKETVHR